MCSCCHEQIGHALRGSHPTHHALTFQARLPPSTLAPYPQAHFRGAKAALQLKQYELCVQLCQEGQRVDPSAAEFASLLKARHWAGAVMGMGDG